jgi:hypothetical protein
MKLIFRLLSIMSLIAVMAVFTQCDDDKEKDTTAEEKQLGLLSKTWTITSATKDTDRTGDFKNPDLALEISGAFDSGNPKGPYKYKITGTMPTPSPWASGSGTWTFGADPSKTIIRGDDVEIHYVLSGNTLTLTFTCTTCGDDNAKVKSAEGEWVFVFTAP